MSRLFAALVLAVCVLGQPAARAAPAADVRGALAEASALVDRARDTEDAAERERLAGEALGALDREPTLASWGWLRDPLTRSPADLDRARAGLQAALSAAGGPTAARDPAAARRALADVLADARFHPGDWMDLVPGWALPAVLLVRALFETAWNVIRWPFDRLLDLLAEALDSAVIAVLGLLALVAVALLYRAGVRSVLVRQAEVAPSPLPLPLTALEAIDAAHQQAALGRFREACHFVLLSALLTVEERGDARFDPSATNREHVRRAQAAARPAVARALAPLVAAFDSVWYGSEVVTEADYRGMLDLATRVREAAA